MEDMEYIVHKEDKPTFLKDKKEVVKVHLYIKLLERGIVPFENDLDILSELFFFNGYSGDSEKKEFYKLLLDKNLRRSDQSTSNKLTEFAEKQIIIRNEKNSVALNPIYFPSRGEKEINGIGLVLKVSHNAG